MTKSNQPCRICAEWRYISLVKVCPICGAPGKSNEVRDTAEEFLRQRESQTFEEIWDAIIPLEGDSAPHSCPRC